MGKDRPPRYALPPAPPAIPGKVSHGVRAWTRCGTISPGVKGHRRIQKQGRALVAELEAHLGGPENLTGPEKILIDLTHWNYVACLLIWSYFSRYSVVRPDQLEKGIVELQPVLGAQFIAYQNSIRQNLVALGLKPKELTPLTADVLRDLIEKEAREGEKGASGRESRKNHEEAKE